MTKTSILRKHFGSLFMGACLAESIRFGKIMLVTMAILGLFWGMAPAKAQAGEIREMNTQQLESVDTILSILRSYIGVTGDYFEMADSQERTMAFAIMELASLYEDMGNPMGAAPELEEIAQQSQGTVRNMALLKLCALYKDSGDQAKALEYLNTVIKENMN